MLTITVHGLPAPQGSKRPLINKYSGTVQLVESSKKVKPWREAVKWAARTGVVNRIDGPVDVDIVFTLPRPKSAPKSRKYPDRKPDIDKLVRSTLDALKDAGAFEDDSRVVCLLAAKVFPGTHPDALDVPGAVIRISEAKGLKMGAAA